MKILEKLAWLASRQKNDFYMLFSTRKKQGMKYRYERKAVEYLKNNDETILNLLFLTLSTIVLKTVDEKMTCRRNHELSSLTIIDDFWSGQYGFDKECLQWKSAIQTFSLFTTIISLIFLTNQAFDCIQEKNNNFSVLQLMIRNFVISSVLMNFTTKFYSSFLKTGVGHWFHGMLLMYFYNRFSFCNNIFEKYYSMLFKNSNYFLFSKLRSRVILDQFYKKL